MKIAEKIKESEPLPGLKLLSVKTPVEGAVTVLGSFLGGSFYDRGKLSPALTAKLLDWGTQKRNKDEIREKLESLGATIRFSVDPRKVRFKIKCLRENLPELVSILAEELKEPLLPGEGLETEKKILIADLSSDKEDPEDVSGRALRGMMFPENHPLHLSPIDRVIEKISAVEIADVKNFYRASCGLGNMIVSASGDLDEKELAEIFKKNFSGFGTSTLQIFPPEEKRNEIKKPPEEKIFIPEKTSVSFKMGKALLIDSSHPDFDSLSLAVKIFGGSGFTSRLMKKVREEKGLSYGVYARLSGGLPPDNIYFSVSATFAPELASEGAKTVKEELQKWLHKGITEEELRVAKEMSLGGFKVGLETMQGVASTILQNAEEGRAPGYLDRYPEIVKTITVSDVNKSIKRHLSGENFVSVFAGTLKN